MKRIIFNQAFIKDKEQLNSLYKLAQKIDGFEKPIYEYLEYSQTYYAANLFYPSFANLKEQFPDMELSLWKFEDEDEERTYLKEKLKDLIDQNRRLMAVKYIDETTPYVDRLKLLDSMSKIEMSLLDSKDIICDVSKFNFNEMYGNMKNKGVGLKTGVEEIDLKTGGGFSHGTVTTILAPSKAGKTSFAISMCYRNLFIENNNTLFMTIELPKNNLYFKMLIRHGVSQKLNVHASDILKGVLTSSQEDKMAHVDADFKKSIKSQLFMLGANDLKFESIITLKMQLIELIQNYDIRSIYLDHAHLLQTYKVDTRQQDREFLNDCIGMFRRLAVDYDCCFLILAQVNKAGEAVAHKLEGMIEPGFCDNATSLQRDSSYFVTLYSNPELLMCNQVKMALPYNRDGESFKNPIIVPAYMDKYIVGDAGIDVHKVMSIDKSKVVIENGVKCLDLDKQGSLEELLDGGDF